MSSDSTPPKRSLLSLALEQHRNAPAPPRGRPRSKNFYGNEAHQRLTGVDIVEWRRNYAAGQIADKKMQLQPNLHKLTKGGDKVVHETGLKTAGQRKQKVISGPYSTMNTTDVFVGGPKVMKKHFGLLMSADRKGYVHVVGPGGDLMHDHDYDHMGWDNDSRSHNGPIPPLRDARPDDNTTRSFMLDSSGDMTPRTRTGASLMMTGMTGYEDESERAIKDIFEQRFD